MAEDTATENGAEVEYTGPLLTAADVSYKYGSFMALSKATFTIQAGELIALVGRNGAGKSTLLRCIAGWTRPSEGEVHVLGELLTQNERAAREHVVLLPDTPPFYDELTAWEHLQFVAQAHGWDNWQEHAEDLLDRYGLLINRDAFPFAFSRGMRYKLALCMALLVEPKLLLMDEPLGPLDPVSADELWIELNHHRDEGMTIILSSHQLPPDAEPNRYFIMEGGEIITQGTAPEIRKKFKIPDGPLTLDNMLRAALRGRKATDA